MDKKAVISVTVRTYFEDGSYVNNVVELEIPEKAGHIIQEAWCGIELPQSHACNAKFLAKNQQANVSLELNSKVVAGINGMCQHCNQDYMLSKTEEDED